MTVRKLMAALKEMDPEMEVKIFNSGINEDSYSDVDSVCEGLPTMYPNQANENDPSCCLIN